MLARFCLYGFLKNQRYFEPFLLLAFLDAGLSFTAIGVLIALREVAVGLFEVPSGAVADVYGRRLAMATSFASYIVAFVIFGVASSVWMYAPAMVLIGLGDAFRSGTHKSMILAWLRLEGRSSEKVAVYGTTRSWSKIGSAVAVPIATAIVLLDFGYAWVFWLSIVPYAANFVNLVTYPRALDGDRREAPGGLFAHLLRSARSVLLQRSLRRVLIEALSMGGVYKSVKDYVQPATKAAAIGLPVLLFLDGEARGAVLIGVVYLVLFALEAVASRRAASLARVAGGPVPAARWLWLAVLAITGTITASLWMGLAAGAIVGFIALAVAYNLYRPMMVSRLDALSEATQSATILSVESQGRALTTLVLAPIIGRSVDLATVGDQASLWPVGAWALGVCLLAVLFVWPLQTPHPTE